MKPILFHFFSYEIPAWHTFFCLGALSIFGSFFYLNTFSDKKLSRNKLIDFYLILYISSYIGARGFSVIMDEHASSLSSFFTKILAVGPMTFYGGFVLALLVGSIYVYTKNMDGLRIFDISLVSVFLGLSLGRIGCFLNGDDYGEVCSVESIFKSLCVVFPNLGDNLFRYPVQLFEASFAFMIFVLGVLMQSNLRGGITGFICILIYSIGRFFLEFFRGDERGYILYPQLSSAQTISIMLFVISTTSLYLIYRKRAAPIDAAN